MPGLMPLILIIVPIIEITLFVQIGGAIGLGWTLLFILATAMLGARAIRRQGIDALARAQAQSARQPSAARSPKVSSTVCPVGRACVGST